MSSTTSHVALTFKTADPIHQAAKGSKIIVGLTNYPLVFSALPMTIAAFTIINNKYSTKIATASGGDAGLVKQRDNYRDKTRIPAMVAYADYVNSVAAGKRLIIIMSGFDATKDTVETHQRPVAMVLTVKGASTREIKFMSKTKVDARSFTVIGGIAGEFSITNNGSSLVVNSKSPVIILPTSNKKGTIGGLTRKDEMDFYIVANNGAGYGPLSNKGNVIIP